MGDSNMFNLVMAGSEIDCDALYAGGIDAIRDYIKGISENNDIKLLDLPWHSIFRYAFQAPFIESRSYELLVILRFQQSQLPLRGVLWCWACFHRWRSVPLFQLARGDSHDRSQIMRTFTLLWVARA